MEETTIYAFPKQGNTWLHIGKPLTPINPSMLEKKLMRNDGME